jgi:pyruvate formate-lyase activating enzyme-like uncharacterized protein
MFMLNKTRLIKYKRVVYLLEQIRKEFTKELHKELTTRHLKIKKTRDICNNLTLTQLSEIR